MKYHLVEGSQNTFVLFDCLNLVQVDDVYLQLAHQRLKQENRDDALILLNGQGEEDSFLAQMLVLGLDGELAEFCGNGALASAAYLFANYPSFKTFALKTNRGVHPLIKRGKTLYSVQLPPASFSWNTKFISNPALLQGHCNYAETGEPHLMFEKMIDDDLLLFIGRELNQRKDLFPLGINVNAWHVLEEGLIFVKTYERGVQRLTQSCGTGSMACAALYQGKGIVRIVTPGGPLEVTLSDHSIELCGEGLITKTIDIL
ncbi:MAG: hypothetical protein KGZ39_08160 [Simkania sp.]|nr:hypothetical protein [Simkania sp.]